MKAKIKILVWAGCFTSFVAWADPALTVKAEGKLRYLKTNREEPIPADKSVTLSEPTLIVSPRKIPVLAIPVSESQTTELDLPDYDQTLPKLFQSQINQTMSAIMIEVSRIQKNLLSRQTDEAFRQVEALLVQYPDMAFLKFLKASVQVVRGQRAEALILAEEAVRAHPDFEEGKQFLEQLKKNSSTKNSP